MERGLVVWFWGEKGVGIQRESPGGRDCGGGWDWMVWVGWSGGVVGGVRLWWGLGFWGWGVVSEFWSGGGDGDAGLFAE